MTRHSGLANNALPGWLAIPFVLLLAAFGAFRSAPLSGLNDPQQLRMREAADARVFLFGERLVGAASRVHGSESGATAIATLSEPQSEVSGEGASR
jgi:hypothetical protein